LVLKALERESSERVAELLAEAAARESREAQVLLL